MYLLTPGQSPVALFAFFRDLSRILSFLFVVSFVFPGILLKWLFCCISVFSVIPGISGYSDLSQCNRECQVYTTHSMCPETTSNSATVCKDTYIHSLRRASKSTHTPCLHDLGLYWDDVRYSGEPRQIRKNVKMLILDPSGGVPERQSENRQHIKYASAYI